MQQKPTEEEELRLALVSFITIALKGAILKSQHQDVECELEDGGNATCPCASWGSAVGTTHPESAMSDFAHWKQGLKRRRPTNKKEEKVECFKRIMQYTNLHWYD